jgi:hypothetical protein
MRRGFRLRIHKAFVSGSSQSAVTKPEVLSMSSISSVPVSAPASPPNASTPQAPEVKVDSAADEARAAASQPPVLAALPPGQGTRIDQLV